MDTGGSSDTNRLSSSWDELGLSMVAWERPPLFIVIQSNFLKGFLHWGQTPLLGSLLQLAFQVWKHLLWNIGTQRSMCHEQSSSVSLFSDNPHYRMFCRPVYWSQAILVLLNKRDFFYNHGGRRSLAGLGSVTPTQPTLHSLWTPPWRDF